MTLADLARAVLALLDQQQAYFRLRDPGKLAECRAAEKALKTTCLALLHPSEPQLFDGEEPPR